MKRLDPIRLQRQIGNALSANALVHELVLEPKARRAALTS